MKEKIIILSRPEEEITPYEINREKQKLERDIVQLMIDFELELDVEIKKVEFIMRGIKSKAHPYEVFITLKSK